MNDLKTAIEKLHHCKAVLKRTDEVTETFDGEIVWQGNVSVFTVDHPDTDTCYAWSSPVEGSERRKFYAVLKITPIDSPEAAVRASIVKDYREEGVNNDSTS